MTVAVRKDVDSTIYTLLTDVGDLREKKVLDVGCGDGSRTARFAEGAVYVCGVDPEEASIQDAGRYAISDKCEFRCGDGTALSFPDNSFERVVFCESLHHIPDPARALEEAVRVVNQDEGRIIVIEPIHAAGSLGAISVLYNDEQVVREKARAAVERALTTSCVLKATCQRTTVTMHARSAREFMESEVLKKKWVSFPPEIVQQIEEQLDSVERTEDGWLLLEEEVDIWVLAPR